MTRRLVVAVAVSCGLLTPAALGDSFTPVRLGITVAKTARKAQPLKVSVAISADTDALDASAPLWLRVKLAPECGGTWSGTPGAVLLNRRLKPQPATGRPYAATLTGSGRPSQLGVQTVCVWLEQQGDDRVFATSQAFTVRVLHKKVKR